MSHPIGHVNTFTTLQFFTGISRNTLSKIIYAAECVRDFQIHAYTH